MKKIAITGGYGYIGAALLPFLDRPGTNVTVIGRRPRTAPLPSSRFRFQLGDLGSRATCLQLFPEFDVIIHLAGLVGFPKCQKDPDGAIRSNLTSTENILSAKRPDAPLILASTVSNYGRGATKVDERTPLAASSFYSETKIAAERLVGNDPASIVYRFASAFGRSPTMRDDLLVHDFVRKALDGESISVFEGAYPRSLVHVRDIARSIIFALDNLEKMQGEIYNVGNPKTQVSKIELLQKIRKVIPFEWREDSQSCDPERRLFEVSFEKLMALGFTPLENLDSALPEIITYYRSRMGKLAA